jgi:two-component system NarL family sensor kinase
MGYAFPPAPGRLPHDNGTRRGQTARVSADAATLIDPRRRGGVRAPAAVAIAALVLVPAGAALAWLTRDTPHASADTGPGQILHGLAYAGLGAAILSRRDGHRLGRLLCLIGIMDLLSAVGQGYIDYGQLAHPGALPATEWIGLLGILWLPAYGLSASVLPLLFPAGETPPGRWRWALRLAVGAIAVATVAVALDPTSLPAPEHGPFGVRGGASVVQAVEGAAIAAFLVSAALAVTSLVLRLRRARGVEREQLRWFAFGAAVLLVAIVAAHFLPGALGRLVELAGLLALPAAAAIAILRHRLYDIDVVIARSVVYGGLTAGVVGGYAAIVAVLGLVLDRHRSGFAVSVLASGAVALAFGPLRARLQRAAERLVYGERSDPYRVLTGLGHRLEAAVDPDAVLPAVVATVTGALRLPHAAIDLHGADGLLRVAETGTPVGTPLELPLVHHGQEVGRLSVSPRGPAESFTAGEAELVAAVARQAGVAAHAVQLTAGLRDSRMRLVSAREEERRRLRRDLHDGLGPTLAGVTLRLDAARRGVATDPQASVAELLALREEVQEAIGSIRELVYDLRPPALDELGLLGALRERAGRLAPLRVSVEADGGLPALPAAIEVAAYRVVQEALANVARHAHARRCSVRLDAGDGLRVEIADDGRGLPADRRAGVGLRSMRERAEELGGRLELADGDPGTIVRAWWPL